MSIQILDTTADYLARVRRLDSLANTLGDEASRSFRSLYLNLATLLETYIDQHLGIANRNWQSRREVCEKQLGVKLTDFRRWPVIDGIILIRNTIAHGNGRLTRLQLDRPLSTLNRIRTARGDVDAGDLVLTDASWHLAKEVSTEFLVWLDRMFRPMNGALDY